MREFFVLTYDNRDDLETVHDYDLKEFDVTQFWSGQRFEGSIPSNVRLWVSDGAPADYMSNPLSWQIASKRLWELIQPHVHRDCQHIIAPLYYQASDSHVPGYLLLNPIRSISAVPEGTASDDICIPDLTLDLRRVPLDVNIFRLAESSTIVLVSDRIVEAVWGKGLKGLAFLKTKLDSAKSAV